MSASAELNGVRRGTPLGRVAAVAMDVVLLAGFLAFGVACLQVLIATIVLAVGYAQGGDPMILVDEAGRVTQAPSRHPRDWMDLGLSVVGVFLFGGLFRLLLGVRRYLFARLIEAGFESFVSKRYLLAREAGGLVSLISVVSVLGVAVGVMALVVVISVMNGFDRALTQKMMGVFSHIEVVPAIPTADAVIEGEDWRPILSTLESTPGVVAVSPIITRQTLFQANTGAGETKVGAVIRGVDPAREKDVTDMMAGVFPGQKASPGFREVVLGSELARKLNARPNMTVYALGRVASTANGAAPRISALRVVGVFQTGLYDVDANFAYASLETVQSLFVLDDAVSALHLRTTDPENVNAIARTVGEALPQGYGLRTWHDLNPEFFKALWIEKVAMFIILLLIVIVASFNIVGTLVMTVVQKTREIGILKSMGAPNLSIAWIFLYHGFLIGTIGTALGIAWGLWVCRFVHNDIERIFQLPEGVYGLDRLPVIVEPATLALIGGSSLAICVLASILPSIRASRLNPVEALRYD